MRDNHLPIIHIIGLPGAGKTTLAKRLSEELKLPIYRISEYRSKFPVSIIGEADAWVALFNDLSRQKWRNCILETTGLNCRESFLRTALPVTGIVTIKLESKKSILYSRIRKKKKKEQGGKWLFSAHYNDKFEFVKKMYKEFQKIPALIKVDSGDLGINDVYKTALDKLKMYTTPQF